MKDMKVDADSYESIGFLMLFFFPGDLMPMSSKRVNSTTISVTRVKVDGEPLQPLEVL